MVRQSFVFLRREQWADPAVKAVLDALCQTVLSPEAEAAPEGLRLHIADIYLDELTAEGAEEVRLIGGKTFLLYIYLIRYLVIILAAGNFPTALESIFETTHERPEFPGLPCSL